MADAVQVQRKLDSLQKFRLLLQIDRDPEYLADVEKQLWTLYESQLRKILSNPDSEFDRVNQISDDLDRVLELLEVIRQVIIKDEHVDWRGALEENVRLLEEKRKQEIETKIAEEKTVSLAEARVKLVKTLTPLLPYADSDILEFAADKVALDCADQPEAALAEAVSTINIIAATTQPDIAIDPLAIAAALEPAAPVLQITYSQFQETTAQIAAEFATQSPVDTSSAAFTYTTNLVTTAAYAGLPDTVIDVSKNSQKIESLALQFLKVPQAAQVTQILTQPQLQLPQLFQSIKQEISAQSQFNKAVDKHVKLSGASKEDQQIAAEVIKRYVMPPMALVYRFTETPEEKQSLANSAYQKFAVQIGLDQYLRGARGRMATISQAVYIQVQSFPYADFQSSMLHRRTLKSGSSASPYMEMFFGQMQNMITDKVAKEVINKAATSLGIKLGTQAAVTVGAEVAVEAGVVAAGAATGPPGWIVAAAAIVVGFAKDIVSKSSRWVKENWPMLAGAVAGLVGGIFAGFAPVGIAAASLAGGAGGTALTQGGISRLGSGASRFFNGIADLAVTEIATPIIVIVMSVPIVIALILFIINNSAYIVPQAVGTISGGVPGQCDLSCFNFSGFSASEELLVKQAACDIQKANSCLTNRLCTSPISIERANRKLGYCGLAYTKSGQRRLELYDGAFDGQCNIVYSLAHELGHIVNRFDPSFSTNYAAVVQPNRSTCLPSYPFYDSDDPIVCTVKGSGEEGNAEDVSETIAVFACSVLGNCGSLYRVGNVQSSFFDSYSAHKQLLNQEFLSVSCTQQPTKKAYVLEGNKSDVVISTLQEISTPRPTCTWAGNNSTGKTLAGAINANFFKTDGSPVGWAGYNNQTQDFGCGNSCATKVFNGSSVVALNNVAKPSMAISGLTLSTANEDGRQVARTAMGINGNRVFLVVLDRGSVADLVNFVTQTLGVSADNSILLDSGSSSTFCTGSQRTAGSNVAVPVSIGLTRGTINPPYVVP